jgi:hypothetical protein
VYSNPHRILEYGDGRRFQVIALNFEVAIVGGALTINEEASEFTWCPATALEGLDIVPSHVERIRDATACDSAAFIR